MKWTEHKTILAVDQASTLSDLLAVEDFDLYTLRWLTDAHVKKFLKTLDEKEAAKLLKLVGSSPDHNFRLLDWLMVIGATSEYRRRSLDTSSNPDIGAKLVARLADFQQDWIGRWWKWRCAAHRGLEITVNPVEAALIDTLSLRDFESTLPSLSDVAVAAIVGRRPDFGKVVPENRCITIARQGLNLDLKVKELIEVISEHGIPSNSPAIIDPLLDLHEKDDAVSRLNEIVRRWRGPAGSDPVSRAMIQGHDRLTALLRSKWSDVAQPSDGRNDRELWNDYLGWRVGEALEAAARAVPQQFRMELGFSVGLRIANKEIESFPEAIEQELTDVSFTPTNELTEVLAPMVRLWSTLRTLAKYQKDSWKHDAELIGLRTKLVEVASQHPELWAQSIPWILARLSELGDVAEAVTLQLSLSEPEVRAALEIACDHDVEAVRLKARGLWSLLNGLEDPEAGLARTLADAAARYIDGIPIFPHPLAPASATWLGSRALEQAISNGVRRALMRFSGEVRDQGADIEEALTKALVKELEVEFRELKPRLKLFGLGRSSSLNPILSVRQRPTSKKLEEAEYGCDLAWVVDADVRNRYRSTWVDLVQVKKSTALYQRSHSPSVADSWVIKNPQLDQILKWSATATYWLIASAGEVLVVPAKHLLAIRQGTGKRASAESFTIGFNDVRSAAIPLEQFLLDLLIGQWVGTTAAEVVEFGLGHNTNIRPRTVIEVTISGGQDRQ